MKYAGAFSAFVVLLMLVPTALGTESTINPGVSIGKVTLGMTEAQVKKAMGKWRYAQADGDHLTVGWGIASWTVVFESGKAVEVDTTLRSQRTTSGVGPGSPWHVLAQSYPHGLCVLEFRGGNRTAELLVPHKGGTQTIFYVSGPRNNIYTGEHTTGWHLAEVHVRTPWTPLNEFGTNGGTVLACKSTWRTGDPG